MVSADLPGHISALVRQLPKTMKYSAQEFVSQHTLYSYYAPFLPQDRAAKVLRCMLSERGGSVHYTVGLMASRIPLPLFLRFCPYCVQADRHNHGEAYWHRSHQLPQVPICPVHDSMLSDSTVSSFGSKGDGLVPLEEIKDIDIFGCFDLAPDIANWLIKLVNGAVWLLENPQLPKHLQYYRERYLAALDQRGLISPNGKRVDQKSLEVLFFQMYPKELLQFLGIPINVEDDHNWLRGMVRKYRKAVHPLLHLLLINLLYETAEAFFSIKKIERGTSETQDCLFFFAKSCLKNIALVKEKREKWIALEAMHPGVGRTRLRKQAPALYAWLYRNDLAWLKERQIEHLDMGCHQQRINWAVRDEETLKQVQEWIERERHRQAKPKRITAIRAAKELGIRAWIEKHPDKLPLSMKRLQQVEESVEMFQIRRIFRVVQYMQEHEIPIVEWRIRRMAALRQRLHPDVESAITSILENRK